MNSPSDTTCSHTGIRFEVRRDDSLSGRRWAVKEVCDEEGCAAAKSVVSHEPSRSAARKVAVQRAEERAEAEGRSVEVRILAKLGTRGAGYDVKRPESLRHDLTKLPDLRLRGALLSVLAGAIAALYILTVLSSPSGQEPFWDELWEAAASGEDSLTWNDLWKLDTSASAASAWAEQLITMFGIVLSIVVAASFTVASRLATDHRGPWVSRREIMMRAAGLSRLGLVALVAVFAAAFVPVTAVRYVAFATALIVGSMMLRAIWWIATHLTSYAAEARERFEHVTNLPQPESNNGDPRL